jgi:acyl-CoA oxidase
MSGTLAAFQSGRKDMEEERAKASFPIRQMTHFLDGGEEATRGREKIMLELERDPTFRVDDIPDLTRPQLRERYATRLQSIVEWVKREPREEFQNRLNNIVIVDPGFLTRIGVHYGLFMNTIVNQGTDEQVQITILLMTVGKVLVGTGNGGL